MKVDELKQQCQEQIALWGDKPEQAEVLLVQRGHWGKRDYRTLLGVKGEVVADWEDGIRVMYPAQELLAAIERIESEGESCGSARD